MIDPELRALAQDALDAMIDQRPLALTRHKDEPRNGFPLPIERNKPAPDGLVTQQYRPLAILEYVSDLLSGAIASRRAKRDRQGASND
jgi:hypothetical protein